MLGTCFTLVMGINAVFSENCVDNKGDELEIKLERFSTNLLPSVCNLSVLNVRQIRGRAMNLIHIM